MSRYSEAELANIVTRPHGPRLAKNHLSATINWVHSLEFYVPVKLVSEANISEHWSKRARRKKAQQLEATIEMLSVLQGRCVQLPCSVRLVRIGPKLLDNDNLAGCFKAIQDAIAKVLKVDDGDRAKVSWDYDQVAIGERRYNLKVQIESCIGNPSDV